jgi:hypothetical protein
MLLSFTVLVSAKKTDFINDFLRVSVVEVPISGLKEE